MKSPRSAVLALLCLVTAPFLCAQEARLSNLAIRAQGGGADTIITGFSISPGGNKTVLIRAVGPTLGAFGVPGVLEDPKLELYSSSGKIAENDNWRPVDADAFTSVGAFPLGANARDAALLAELAPGSYTAQVSGVDGSAGVTLVEVYEVSGGTTRLVNLSTRAQVGTGGNILIPGITISPGAGTRRLLLRAVGPTLGSFGVPGTIVDPKLELFANGTKTAENDNWGTPISGGATAEQLSAAFTASGAFQLTSGSRDAALLISLSSGSYTLQISGVGNTTGEALVEVYDLTPPPPTTTLFVAQLRPVSSATGSTASGYATILLNPEGTLATVNVSFSNLSSAQTSGYLKIGDDLVFSLSTGQVTDRAWTFAPTAAYTTAQLIDALKTGRISVHLDSAKFPTGELRGAFIVSAGSRIFTAPPAPPALAATALSAPTEAEAARFLTQTTFGPTTADIAALRSQGINAWIDQQMALPASSHLAATRADLAAFPNPPSMFPPTITYLHSVRWARHAAFWKIWLTGQDQLRQRVAFALSEIFVVSQDDSELGNETESIASYHDLLVNGAFGNYRQLLENITLHPAMGIYLSHRGNKKADPVANTFPDENYAREVMQLFSIGLVQLHPDGTLLLDDSGRPLPTYDQTTISETAKVLTGWHYTIPNATGGFGTFPPSTYPSGAPDGHGKLIPMKHANLYHDKSQKRIVSLEQLPLDRANPTVVPANQTGAQDLKILLDTLYNHPNTGPFIAKHLIKRLVTSNPSAGYVYRVAQAFANDGTGTRGNLGAVVRAILTDYEARSPAVLNNIGYGKIKEPILRGTAFFRVLKAAAPNGRYLDSYLGDSRSSDGRTPTGLFASARGQFNQALLHSPSVFNFFSPDYVVPGAMAAAGLVAPEMEIIDSTFALQMVNGVTNYMTRTPPAPTNPPTPSPFITLNYDEFLPNARDYPKLVEQLNLLFCAGGMSTAARAEILAQLQILPASRTDLERVQTAIYLAFASPDSALQR